CHSINTSMEETCAACHQTDAFTATVIKPHREAGITCLSCHTEHRGKDFSPMKASLDACANCHKDSNKNLYNGRSVHTPHSGDFGYPMKDKEWIWKGLDDEELATKPEIVQYLEKSLLNRPAWSGLTIPEIVRRVKDKSLDPKMRRDWLSTQFHGIHVRRVGVQGSIEGIDDVDSKNKVLSCSSCHKNGIFEPNLDRTSPRATCAKCHTNQIFERADSKLPSAFGPSCTSCHVQHIKDTHWTPRLFRTPAVMPEIQDIEVTSPALTTQ
ncbi:MAG TPA: hypothetical protein VEQ40_13470, partial [Pyrinomonadaceae bacterium]|nr:hypothetical protein [Pyrinomonadaceae bacterium]